MAQHRTALITGAGSGIGAATAHRLRRDGWRLICLGLTQAELARHLPGDDPGLRLVALDLSETDAIGPALARATADFGPVDAVVNNAGIDPGGQAPFADVPADTIRPTVAVNLVAPMMIVRHLLPQMLARDEGHLVAVSSVLAQTPGGDMCAYTASKFGLHGFCEALRHDLRGTRIRVTEIMPGTVRTEFARNRWPGDLPRAEAFYDRFPAALSADDIAGTIAFVMNQPGHVQHGVVSVMPSRF